MNRPILRSLFQDALYQVLDNLGFRILFLLFLVPVAMSFALSFREETIGLLGIWEWNYGDFITGAMSGSGAPVDPSIRAEVVAGARDQLLQQLVSIVLDWVADKFGFVFGIAAISFFVPQMLERGAADVVFSKPVSRGALFFSRYLAGLIFVGLLSTVLVGGITLGFAVSSRYFDSGLLWSIPTLMYGFAIFHAISCTIGVFTRSSIAALLLTLVFMPVNCGLHKGWESIAVAEATQAEYRAAHPEVPEEESSSGYAMLRTGLTAYHVLAPKSGDATRIAKGWRRSIEVQPEFSDEDLGLAVAQAPAGFRREPRSSFTGEGLQWLAPHPDGAGEASWTLRSQDIDETGSRSSVVKKLRKELGVDPLRGDISNRYTDRFEWVEDRGGEKRLRRRWVFQIGDRLLTLDYDAESGWARAAEQETTAQAFVAGFSVREELERQMTARSYDRYFGWGGPWQFNAWFSVGTTLLFVIAVLGLGLWKLSRIDF